MFRASILDKTLGKRLISTKRTFFVFSCLLCNYHNNESYSKFLCALSGKHKLSRQNGNYRNDRKSKSIERELFIHFNAYNL